MSAAQWLFAVFALGTCGGAVAVVLSQNVVRMAFWLVVSLGSVAGLFFLLNADFVAAAQLLIYVGGTVVLLIFGVMLTASGHYLKIAATPGEGVLGGAIGLLFLAMISATVMGVDWTEAAKATGRGQPVDATSYNEAAAGNTARPLGMALLGLRPDRDLGAAPGRTSAGYLLPFEIVSVHLLVVLIGASYLARAKRRREEDVPPA